MQLGIAVLLAGNHSLHMPKIKHYFSFDLISQFILVLVSLAFLVILTLKKEPHLSFEKGLVIIHLVKQKKTNMCLEIMSWSPII